MPYFLRVQGIEVTGWVTETAWLSVWDGATPVGPLTVDPSLERQRPSTHTWFPLAPLYFQHWPRVTVEPDTVPVAWLWRARDHTIYAQVGDPTEMWPLEGDIR